jgi:hypothetical protein
MLRIIWSLVNQDNCQIPYDTFNDLLCIISRREHILSVAIGYSVCTLHCLSRDVAEGASQSESDAGLAHEIPSITAQGERISLCMQWPPFHLHVTCKSSLILRVIACWPVLLFIRRPWSWTTSLMALLFKVSSLAHMANGQSLLSLLTENSLVDVMVSDVAASSLMLP